MAGKKRLDYEASCRAIYPGGPIPPMPTKRPSYDDPEPLGLSFFRTRVGPFRFDSLTLPRTFFGRSEMVDVSFRDTDLSESTICWNDFFNVDFKDAKLENSDMRATVFIEVDFTRCDLRGCDIRHSSFKNGDFTDARMDGAKLTTTQGKWLKNSEDQRKVIDWQESDGELPGGG